LSISCSLSWMCSDAVFERCECSGVRRPSVGSHLGQRAPAGASINRIVPASMRRRAPSIGWLPLEALEAFRSTGVSKIEGAAVPGRRPLRISQGSPNPRADKKLRIECRSQPQRCGTVTRIGGALVEQAR
jgi:hypothetical protein